MNLSFLLIRLEALLNSRMGLHVSFWSSRGRRHHTQLGNARPRQFCCSHLRVFALQRARHIFMCTPFLKRLKANKQSRCFRKLFLNWNAIPSWRHLSWRDKQSVMHPYGRRICRVGAWFRLVGRNVLGLFRVLPNSSRKRTIKESSFHSDSSAHLPRQKCRGGGWFFIDKGFSLEGIRVRCYLDLYSFNLMKKGKDGKKGERIYLILGVFASFMSLSSSIVFVLWGRVGPAAKIE